MHRGLTALPHRFFLRFRPSTIEEHQYGQSLGSSFRGAKGQLLVH